MIEEKEAYWTEKVLTMELRRRGERRGEERRENRSLKFVKKQNGESKTKNKFDILKNILN